MILAIETSCDDTCAAIVDRNGQIRSNVISSQGVHDRFGGVVPELASREHLRVVNLVVDQALDEAATSLSEVSLVGATRGPGLVGALLVGLSTGKAIAAARQLPFVGVDHLQGHVAANFLSNGDPDDPDPLEVPFICLIASGGHTLLAVVREHHTFQTIGQTLDDAAGEAFDKGARMLGLGYPGGAALEALAAKGDPCAFEFPGADTARSRGGRGVRAQAFANSLDFSFAGLKTALRQRVQKLSPADLQARRSDLAASYEAAIVQNLTSRLRQAIVTTGIDRIAIGGGVAANDSLRDAVAALDVEVHIPTRILCTDNAAMIASAARYDRQIPYPEYLSLDAYPSGERPLPSGDQPCRAASDR